MGLNGLSHALSKTSGKKAGGEKEEEGIKRIAGCRIAAIHVGAAEIFQSHQKFIASIDDKVAEYVWDFPRKDHADPPPPPLEM